MAFRLMIVDDDETLLEGLQTAVRWQDVEMQVSAIATDGKAALDKLRQHPCDVLLTDIRMGRMDGLELAETVLREFPSIRVVMMSAFEDFSYAQQAVRLGAEDYLLKPIDLEQLNRTMRKVVEGLKKRRMEEERQHAMDKRMEALKRHAYESYSRAKCALDAPLLDKLAKATLLGSLDKVDAYMSRLESHLRQMDDPAGVFTATAVGIVVEQVEAGRPLTGESAAALEALRRSAGAGENAEKLLMQLSLCLREIAQEASGDSGDIQNLIFRARDYIDSHFAEPALRIREVSDHVGLSTNYFSAMFVKYVGETFSDYLTHTRMREAQLLVSHTHLRAYEVAHQVGYDNPAYFSTCFKNHTGKTVSQFRKAAHGK